ncbi:MAG TPA: hypothetical protein ENO14_03490 [Chromatiales bacterium]|nr:hypothetical protein [Chromatiales bacterium]
MMTAATALTIAVVVGILVGASIGYHRRGGIRGVVEGGSAGGLLVLTVYALSAELLIALAIAGVAVQRATPEAPVAARFAESLITRTGPTLTRVQASARVQQGPGQVLDALRKYDAAFKRLLDARGGQMGYAVGGVPPTSRAEADRNVSEFYAALEAELTAEELALAETWIAR